MMPRAGGQYVYLREAFSPLWGFLYGWTLFLVIQTGTVAAVARRLRALSRRAFPGHRRGPLPDSADPPQRPATRSRCRSPSSSAISIIALLTWTNTRGLDYGRSIQNIFTTAKTGALAALIVIGLALGANAETIAANFGDCWTPLSPVPLAPGLTRRPPSGCSSRWRSRRSVRSSAPTRGTTSRSRLAR